MEIGLLTVWYKMEQYFDSRQQFNGKSQFDYNTYSQIYNAMLSATLTCVLTHVAHKSRVLFGGFILIGF